MKQVLFRKRGNCLYSEVNLVISSNGHQFSGGAKVQVTGHMSQVIVLPIQEVSQTLVKANLRPN